MNIYKELNDLGLIVHKLWIIEVQNLISNFLHIASNNRVGDSTSFRSRWRTSGICRQN